MRAAMEKHDATVKGTKMKEPDAAARQASEVQAREE